MFAVPGKYAGGATDAYTWTQTLNEIELRAPVPAGPPERSVDCTFTAKRLELKFKTSAKDLEPVAVGELSAVLHLLLEHSNEFLKVDLTGAVGVSLKHQRVDLLSRHV